MPPAGALGRCSARLRPACRQAAAACIGSSTQPLPFTSLPADAPPCAPACLPAGPAAVETSLPALGTGVPSCPLMYLLAYPPQVAVVCAGAKSVLDIPRTLEFLETQARGGVRFFSFLLSLPLCLGLGALQFLGDASKCPFLFAFPISRALVVVRRTLHLLETLASRHPCGADATAQEHARRLQPAATHSSPALPSTPPPRRACAWRRTEPTSSRLSSPATLAAAPPHAWTRRSRRPP